MEDLLYNYFSGKMSASEKAAFLDRVNADEDLKREFAAIRNAVALSGLQGQADDDVKAVTALRQLKRRSHRAHIRRLIVQLSTYVAVVLLIVTTWLVARNSMSSQEDNYTVVSAPSGQRVTMTLADGSTVTLSPNSHLLIPLSFKGDSRQVSLSGEAFFHVVKDAEHPFIVHTDKYSLKVLGTEFNVFAYPRNSFEAHLVRGRLYVFDKTAPKGGLYMSPGDKIFVRDGLLCKTREKYSQPQFESDGIYDFNGFTLAQIINRLEVWYGMDIKVVKPGILTKKFKGKFRQSDDAMRILQALSATGEFKVRRNADGEIELY